MATGSTTPTIGVKGLTSSLSGAGVYGVLVSPSSLGAGHGDDTGVWGDTGSAGGFAMQGTADDGTAAYFENNSGSGYSTVYIAAHGSGNPLVAVGPQGYCSVDSSGDLSCTGSKSAVVPVDKGSRQVALYAVEAPENWFEDFGSGQLSGGAADISFESTFAQTVNAGVAYHVFLTPKGDCKGLYVSNETAEGFEVHELGGGASSVQFDYRIVARRKGYETIRLADKTSDLKRLKLQRPK